MDEMKRKLNTQDIEAKIDDLLSRMTLKEKVGQTLLENAFGSIDWSEVARQQKLADEKGLPYEIPLQLSATIEEHVRNGQVSAINSSSVQLNNHLQHLAMEESRLRIPLLVGHDVLHGFRTIFPIPLAASCTWNPELIERARQDGGYRSIQRGHQLDLCPHGGYRP